MEASSSEWKTRPVIAILTMDDPELGFRGNRNNFIDLIRTGKTMGVLVYVVTPAQLRPQQKRLVAHVYDPAAKTWSTQWVPAPHVVYNRIPFRKDETQPEAQHAIQSCLSTSGVQLFNPFFFNKWSLFEWLNGSPKTKRYIPVTKKLSGSAELGQLLKSHSTLYLKPERGKAGAGIMKVQRALPSAKRKPQYWLTVQEERASQTIKFPELSAVWASIKQNISDEDYIIQQGIPLSSYRKRPFDLRVLIQKNIRGLWAVTGIGARVAGKESITTHVPRGGTIDRPSKLLTSAFGASAARRMLRRARLAALRIARQIELKCGHRLGEMSMDLGVDTSGHIWFFEANAKPMKFDEPHIRQKSLARIIQYSTFLARSKRAK